ncbi:PTS sugar transporter subunit IIC [[Clostridium] symbiosum]|uniref:PTS transporter subunit IIC n=1 Tax=Clostridium symbiosum TaxID=1512 RepID=UPI001D06CD5B|nr:PTS sugar transporter subunit IIC [[Clostridium] symbiosum]MCB6608128.1 PTS sugar transporter subunit IIC [[Clostridium] symbiosum]MCB6931032.1 PTS sugar transporter subunit IIC [[Clostridium] symbiosum]
MSQSTFKDFLKRKQVNVSVQTYLIDALGAMAFGLFASLLIGTIFATLGDKTHIEIFTTISAYAKSATGAALGVSIAFALKAPPLVLFSAATVGIAGNELGGPVGALVATIIATELGKIVSKETPVDILVTPGVTIISGVLASQFVGPGVSAFMTAFGNLVKTATVMQPLFMGILVSALIGIALTLPISSAAICIMLSLDGLAGGAATAGCCAQMVGFAILSFRENKWGGLLAQGLGTSMLQMGNIVRNPRIWIPPTLASMVTGPISTMVFKLENIPTGSGMGTCGLVGPIGIYTAMQETGGTNMWLGILLVCFILPAVLTPLFGLMCRKAGWIKEGDLKLDL